MLDSGRRRPGCRDGLVDAARHGVDATQAAWAEFGSLVEGRLTPAQQHPDHAMVLTAGLAGMHDLERPTASTPTTWATVPASAPSRKSARHPETVQLLGEDVWIAVALPGQAQGCPTEGVDVIAQWMSAADDTATRTGYAKPSRPTSATVYHHPGDDLEALH
ncbi:MULTISPECIES: hypothetical protein [Micromonosporaceae]|uniref:Uncharacterized protein n=3 Tax=Micromonosporaceae TaxID=28056 RepID=A0A8J3L2Z5_9ACTN|nr:MULTISPECIES: hypothetical protein [Micromonosporaceae]MCP2325185.1 hypothetical protein [Hamadaea flava]GIG05685.1 hypothetical protein Cco03nite_23850 [Catellatospora coxensis]